MAALKWNILKGLRVSYSGGSSRCVHLLASAVLLIWFGPLVAGDGKSTLLASLKETDTLFHRKFSVINMEAKCPKQC
jgi:hypothetical protein